MPAAPQRASRLDPATQRAVILLDIRQVPRRQIASKLGVHPRSVKRLLERHYAALAVERDVSEERGRSLATYREVQRTAWEAVDAAKKRGRSPAMLLAEIRQAQQQVDKLLGLVPDSPDDPVLVLAQFKATVVQLIQSEAPQLAPVLAQRLLEVADHDERD